MRRRRFCPFSGIGIKRMFKASSLRAKSRVIGNAVLLGTRSDGLGTIIEGYVLAHRAGAKESRDVFHVQLLWEVCIGLGHFHSLRLTNEFGRMRLFSLST
jgi:hypothetical protein